MIEQRNGRDQARESAGQDYRRALRSAVLHRAVARLRNSCNDLVETGRILEHLEVAEYHNRGLQEVPLERIVGSSGRSGDFDLAFRPRHRATEGRWLSVAQAAYERHELPPPRLIQVSHSYFVEDGNHRVSVARSRNQKTIQAQVVELKVDGLVARPSCQRLGFKVAKGQAPPGNGSEGGLEHEVSPPSVRIGGSQE